MRLLETKSLPPSDLMDGDMPDDFFGGVHADGLCLAQPPAPLPVFGSGFQNGLHSSRNTPSIRSYIDTPDSSASPSSLYFPQSSLNGSWTGPLLSYSTTPLSSTSSVAPRNISSSHGRVLQKRLSEVQIPKYPDFIHETPNLPKQKADKSQRSCMLCFREKSKCLGDDPNRCARCLGNVFHCKGPIMTPRLVDLESTFSKAALALSHRPSGSPSANLSLTVQLNLQPLPESVAVPSETIFTLTIYGQGDDWSSSWDATGFDDVLDALVAVKPTQVSELNPLYDLKSFERLCRRFCHCLSILRCLDRCTLSPDNINHPTAIHVVVNFICHLSRKAQNLLTSIFNELRLCCSAKRQRDHTLKLMFDLTDHMGEICKEIGALNKTLLLGEHPPMFDNFFEDAAKTMTDIENIARGLRVEDFNFANRSAPLQFGGLCIRLPVASTAVPFELPLAGVSFVEVLANSNRLNGLSTDHAMSAAVDDPNLQYYLEPMSEMGLSSLLDGYSSNYGATDASHSIPYTSNAGSIPGNADAPGLIMDWEAETNASLNPGWSLYGDPFPSLPSRPIPDSTAWAPSNSITFPHAELEPLTGHGRHSRCQDTLPTDFPIPGETRVGVRAHLLAEPNPLRTSSLMDGQRDSNIVIKSHTPTQKPSKRRRLSSRLTRNKKWVPFPHAAGTDTNRNGATPSTSPSQPPMNTEAPSPLAQIARSVDRLRSANRFHPLRIIKTDWVSSWNNAGTRDLEPQNVSVVRDVNVAECHRRPISWPLRQHLRNSYDISVSALHNLRIDDEHDQQRAD